ncbi:GXM2 [Scenedesmus sp. PABB004]|nr:GXM2 [Scenedesmus sp. PABB004]
MKASRVPAASWGAAGAALFLLLAGGASASGTAAPCTGRWMDVLSGVASGATGELSLTDAQMGIVATALAAARHAGRRPRLVVFGAGYDSALWAAINCDGDTTIIENDAERAAATRAAAPGLDIELVSYRSDSRRAAEFYAAPWAVELPHSVAGSCPDAVLIDSPAAYDPAHGFPGRFEPSYAAIALAERCVSAGRATAVALFLHDAQRPEEREAIARLFAPHPLVTSLGVLHGGSGSLAAFVLSTSGAAAAAPAAPAGAHPEAVAAGGQLAAAPGGARGRWLDAVDAAHSGPSGRPQISVAQLALIASSLKWAGAQDGGRPTRLLVWGVGHDSVAHAAINAGGATLFLEDNAEWLAKISGAYPALSIEQVAYRATVAGAAAFFAAPWLMHLPAAAAEGCWDTILIDAPAGYRPEHPGRVEASYAALRLAEACVASGRAAAVTLFLHDVGRPLEREIMARLFDAHPLVRPLGVVQGHGTRWLAGYVMSAAHGGGGAAHGAAPPRQPAPTAAARHDGDGWSDRAAPGAAPGGAGCGALPHPSLTTFLAFALGVLAGLTMRAPASRVWAARSPTARGVGYAPLRG